MMQTRTAWLSSSAMKSGIHTWYQMQSLPIHQDFRRMYRLQQALRTLKPVVQNKET